MMFHWREISLYSGGRSALPCRTRNQTPTTEPEPRLCLTWFGYIEPFYNRSQAGVVWPRFRIKANLAPLYTTETRLNPSVSSWSCSLAAMFGLVWLFIGNQFSSVSLSAAELCVNHTVIKTRPCREKQVGTVWLFSKALQTRAMEKGDSSEIPH